MERDDWYGEDGDYVEVSVPTELVKRVISGMSNIMQEWEGEASGRDEEFSALIGVAAMKIALDFIETSLSSLEGRTIQ